MCKTPRVFETDRGIRWEMKKENLRASSGDDRLTKNPSSPGARHTFAHRSPFQIFMSTLWLNVKDVSVFYLRIAMIRETLFSPTSILHRSRAPLTDFLWPLKAICDLARARPSFSLNFTCCSARAFSSTRSILCIRVRISCGCGHLFWALFEA